jgi:alcohol dehydrogenase
MDLGRFLVRYGRTTLYFGPGTIDSLGPWLSSFRRVYVVTSKSAAKVSGALSDLLKLLNREDIRFEVFNEVFANPTVSVVDRVAESAWRFGAEAIVAVGGGSVIDTAKIASVISECGGRAYEYLKGLRNVCNALKVAAVNLTHGTGSEVDRYAVATVEETKEKLSIASEYLYPSVGIDDPKYTITLPKNQTIYTTLDAFYHALEASTGRFTSPFAWVLGEAAIKLIVKWLPIAVKLPEDLEARYWLLYASAIAGMAVDNSRTHLIHAVEHVLSGLEPRLAHGAGLGILGPAAVEALYSAVPERLHRLLKYVDPDLEPIQEHATKAAAAVKRFQEGVGFTETLSDYGFTPDMAPRISEIALRSTRYLLDLAPMDVGKDLVEKIYLRSLRRY